MNKPGIALVPVADLLDHDNTRHVGWHTGPPGTQPFQFLTYTSLKQVRLYPCYKIAVFC